jgi:hypothetical protein
VRSFSAFQLTASNRQISIPNAFEITLAGPVSEKTVQRWFGCALATQMISY